MSVDVEVSRVIHRPRMEVAEYAANVDNATAWYSNIKSVEWKTPRPLGVGTRVAFVAQFLGRRLSYTYEIVEYSPGSVLRMRTAEGPFPMETTYRWSDAPGGASVMRLRNVGMPKGFGRLVAPFMAVAMRSAMTKDLARLGSILEASR
jgi:uncharacterized membrane protein